jgi:hypothetical protein
MKRRYHLERLNDEAQAIAATHPDDYHTRPDYRAIVDRRSAVLQGKEAPNENPA